jgi:hypothetical protein
MDEKKSNEELAEKGRNIVNKEFTDEKRKKVQRRLLLILVILPISISFNTILAYATYIKNQEYFIENYISDSLIGIVTTGEFPHVTVFIMIFTIFLLAYAYILVKNKKITYESTTWTFIFIGVIFILWQIIGGLLWLLEVI